MKFTCLSCALSFASLLVSGCASVAETSTSAGAGSNCKVVMAQPARLHYDPARASDADKAEARARLASFELKQPPLRSQADFHGTIDQALRDCP